MGRIIHDVFIATGYKDEIEALREFAIEHEPSEGGSVSPINQAFCNSFHSFAIFPDGSKVGWEISEKFRKFRTLVEFKAVEMGIENVRVKFGEID